VRALTVRQPWASLIACGVKTIETRSWSTKYRGPLLIHAGKATPETSQWEEGPFDDIGWGDLIHQFGADAHEETRRVVPDSWWLMLAPDHRDYIPMPLGAVVAAADLVDVVPVEDLDAPFEEIATLESPSAIYVRPILDDEFCLLTYRHESPVRDYDKSDQIPFGDFTPGHYGWLLDNVRPLAIPVPAKGKQGLWTPSADLLEEVVAASGSPASTVGRPGRPPCTRRSSPATASHGRTRRSRGHVHRRVPGRLPWLSGADQTRGSDRVVVRRPVPPREVRAVTTEEETDHA